MTRFTTFRNHSKQLLQKTALPLAFWLGFWQLAALSVGKELLLPSPLATAARLAELAVTEDFWRSALISLGRILGGFLADSVFEPFMASGSAFAGFLHRLVGYGNGSGMAVMFLCTSLCGTLFSLFCYRSKGMDELRAPLKKRGGEIEG